MNILDCILAAKDKRSSIRQEIAYQGFASISLNLNIPGYPKSSPIIRSFFKEVLKEFKIYAKINQIPLLYEKAFCLNDPAGDFYICPLDTNNETIKQVKQKTELFEKQHIIGRMIDIDVCNSKGEAISSNKKKMCFFCKEKPAIVCMREKNHDLNKLRLFQQQEFDKYLTQKKRKNIERRLTAIATKAILHEVSLTPKAGLVDCLDAGCHKDMDFKTFVNSSATISVFFPEIIKKAFEFKNSNFKSVLKQLRPLGIEMENAMFEETGGINTQKGIIFLIGLSLFSSAYIIEKQNYFSKGSFREMIKTICADLVNKELKNSENILTNGAKCFSKYGMNGAGIRLEAEEGFPTVFNYALPKLKKYLDNETMPFSTEKFNKALHCSILSLMANNNDTNILHRSNEEVLEKLKKLSKTTLDELENNNVLNISELDRFCKEYHISSGGSADLLSIAIFIYLVEREFPK